MKKVSVSIRKLESGGYKATVGSRFWGKTEIVSDTLEGLFNKLEKTVKKMME